MRKIYGASLTLFFVVFYENTVFCKPVKALPKLRDFPLFDEEIIQSKFNIREQCQQQPHQEGICHNKFNPKLDSTPRPCNNSKNKNVNNSNPNPVVHKNALLKCAEVRLQEAEDGSDGTDTNLPHTDAIMSIVKATDFASHKHHFQRRKDPEGTPYIEHPVAVAHILTHIGKVSNPVVIIAALLHDTVEDTETTLEEIEQEFGTKVKNVVAELTDDKHLTRDERKRLQILHAPFSSHEAKLVKLADKLHNLRDIEKSLPVSWTEERKTQYFNWAREVVKGLRGTNRHIEAALDKMFVKYCTPEDQLDPKTNHQ